MLYTPAPELLGQSRVTFKNCFLTGRHNSMWWYACPVEFHQLPSGHKFCVPACDFWTLLQMNIYASLNHHCMRVCLVSRIWLLYYCRLVLCFHTVLLLIALGNKWSRILYTGTSALDHYPPLNNVNVFDSSTHQYLMNLYYWQLFIVWHMVPEWICLGILIQRLTHIFVISIYFCSHF